MSNIFLRIFYFCEIFNYFLLLIFLDQIIFLVLYINDPLEICVLNIPRDCIICIQTYLLKLQLFCILQLDINFQINFSYLIFIYYLHLNYFLCIRVVLAIYGQDNIFFYNNYIKTVKNHFIYNLICYIIIQHPSIVELLRSKNILILYINFFKL